MPSKTLQGLTPVEVLTGRKPDLSHVRVWGSRVFIHVNKSQRRKLDAKGVEGRLVCRGIVYLMRMLDGTQG
ncbi:hypothetical protein, partial [Loigolactobacillus coryniformis]